MKENKVQTQTKEKPQAQVKPASLKKIASKRGRVTSMARRSDLAGSDVGLDLTTFAGRLTALRLAENLTQTDVGDHIDRTRQMINRYESGQSLPDLEILEKLAKRFGVSATYLAFGEHAVKSVKVPNPGLTVNVDEVTLSKSGRRITGSYLLPKALVESYVENVRSLRIFVLDHDAKLFGMSAGDRLFLDTSIDRLTIKHSIYAIELGGEMQVVEYLPSNGKGISYRTPENRVVSTSEKDLKVLGAVVSRLSRV